MKRIRFPFLIILGCFSIVSLSFAVNKKGNTAIEMEKRGLVNILDKDSTLRVRLMYAQEDNVFGRILYKDLREAYLHPLAADALCRAQQFLRANHPHLTLIIYDAARPMHIQQQMWNAVVGTPQQNYVSNPRNKGGLHNYGLAVDVSLYDIERQDTLAMGTKVDYLGEYSHITNEKDLVVKGVMTEQARQNRLLLRKVMMQAGFIPLRTEWWHFNLMSRTQAAAKYPVIP